MRRVSGFTLVELIVVIAILAILAATAIPKFVDLSADARDAAARGITGAIASGAAVNYAAKVAGNASATVINACTDANLGQLITGGLPTGAAISGASTPSDNGVAFNCDLTYSVSGGAVTVTFSLIGVTSV